MTSTNKVGQAVCSLRGKAQGKKNTFHHTLLLIKLTAAEHKEITEGDSDECINIISSTLLSSAPWWLSSRRTMFREISVGKST